MFFLHKLINSIFKIYLKIFAINITMPAKKVVKKKSSAKKSPVKKAPVKKKAETFHWQTKRPLGLPGIKN